jgi:hypothetical protein
MVTTSSQQDTKKVLTHEQLQCVTDSLRRMHIKNYSNDPSTANQVVQWLLDTFGSIIAAIVMYFLHRWLPSIFPTSKIKSYRVGIKGHVNVKK